MIVLSKGGPPRIVDEERGKLTGSSFVPNGDLLPIRSLGSTNEHIDVEAPNRAQQIFQPQFRLGLAGLSLGNEFNNGGLLAPF
jgi:hypothetical protein